MNEFDKLSGALVFCRVVYGHAKQLGALIDPVSL